ncbi:hypothetical protein C2767_08810 [Klebsiella quasipneumoniae]|nr:hypothetical protein DP204_08985 [Klebsiella quasipneumoniae subsp. quasipneumoniae]QEY77735.1 hypothetical protein C2767_08810 [Klebsiella quasipneumoniae]
MLHIKVSNYIISKLGHFFPINLKLNLCNSMFREKNFTKPFMIINYTFPMSTLSIRTKHFTPVYRRITNQGIANASIRKKVPSTTIQVI